MADVVRILGLDDDNHSPIFRMETGEIFGSPRELIEFLAHSHDVEYQVKMFAIVDEIPQGFGLADYDESQIDWMFYHLEGLTSSLPDGVLPEAVFDLFWVVANRRHW